MTLLDYVDTLRRHWLVVLCLTLLGGVAGWGYASTQPEVYRASATVLVSADSAGSAADLVQGSTYVENLVASYAVMATSELVLRPVIDDLDLETTPKALAGSLSVETPVGTVLIQVNADQQDPVVARRVADAVVAELAQAVSEVSPTVGESSAVRVTTIQPATVPQVPIAPNPRFSAALGGAVGLVLGVVLALVRRAFGSRVGDSSDVAAVTSTPVIGEIVETARRQSLPAAVLEEPRSAEAESLRAVAANMHYLGFDGGLRSLLVTSGSPAEGKSSIACAMALIIKEAAPRVLLIDADLRSPSLHQLTGLEPGVGLSTVLVGDIDLASAVQPWGAEGLDVLTSGALPPNPGQLLNSDAVKDLIGQAERAYDMVIVDTGPLALVSDAVWLGHLVDGVVVVARRGKTRTRALGGVLKTLAAARTPAAGVLINRAKRPRRSKYSYGYSSPATAQTHRRMAGLAGRRP